MKVVDGETRGGQSADRFCGEEKGVKHQKGNDVSSKGEITSR